MLAEIGTGPSPGSAASRAASGASSSSASGLPRGRAVEALERVVGVTPARRSSSAASPRVEPGEAERRAGRRRRAATARPRARRARARSGRRAAAGRRTAAPRRSRRRAGGRRRRAARAAPPRPTRRAGSASRRRSRSGRCGRRRLQRERAAERARLRPGDPVERARARGAAARRAPRTAPRPPTRRRARAARASPRRAAAACSSSAVLPIPGSPTSASTPLRPVRASARSRSSARRSCVAAQQHAPILTVRRSRCERPGAALRTRRPPDATSDRAGLRSLDIRTRRPSMATIQEPAVAIDGEKLEQFVFRAVERGRRDPQRRAGRDGRQARPVPRARGRGRADAASSSRAAAGVSERYVREWLNAQAAGGYVDLRPGRRHLHAAARADRRADRRGEPGLSAGLLPDRARHRHRLAAHHRGRPQRRRLRLARAQPRRVRGLRAVLPARLQRQPDPVLAAGARRRRREARARRDTVADIGCGHGVSTILMAQAFPNSTFVGSDYHDGLDRDGARARAGRPASATACASRSRPPPTHPGDGLRPRDDVRLPARHGRPGRRGAPRPRDARRRTAPG